MVPRLRGRFGTVSHEGSGIKVGVLVACDGEVLGQHTRSSLAPQRGTVEGILGNFGRGHTRRSEAARRRGTHVMCM